MKKYNMIYLFAGKSYTTVIYSDCEENAIDQFWKRYPSVDSLKGVF